MKDDMFKLASPGQIYVCACCGKTSGNRAGFDEITGRRLPNTHRGWDESCFLHAVLCYEKANPEDTWVAVDEEP